MAELEQDYSSGALHPGQCTRLIVHTSHWLHLLSKRLPRMDGTTPTLSKFAVSMYVHESGSVIRHDIRSLWPVT